MGLKLGVTMMILGLLIVVSMLYDVDKFKFHEEIGECYDRYGSEIIGEDCIVSVCDNCDRLSNIMFIKVAITFMLILIGSVVMRY